MGLTPITIMEPGKGDPNGPWRKGPAITAEDLKRGTGSVERIKASEVFGNRAAPAQAARNGAKTRVTVMRFGKHKGQSVHWVKDNDPGYYRWACENVRGFQASTDDGQDQERDERD